MVTTGTKSIFGFCAGRERCLNDPCCLLAARAGLSLFVGPRTRAMSLILRHLFTLLISALAATGALVNITVDDSGLNQLTELPFSYSPTADWNFGPNCTECVAHLDRSQLYKGTWHDATYDGSQGPRTELQSATLDFNGNVPGSVTANLMSDMVPQALRYTYLV